MNKRLLICLFFTTSILMVLVALDSVIPVLAARWPIISTVGGGGPAGYCGDGSFAYTACLNFPISMGVSGNNNLFIADTFNHRIRMIAAGI